LTNSNLKSFKLIFCYSDFSVKGGDPGKSETMGKVNNVNNSLSNEEFEIL